MYVTLFCAYTLSPQDVYKRQEQGNGLADVLFGKVNPAGRTVQTWVKDITDPVSYTHLGFYYGSGTLRKARKTLVRFNQQFQGTAVRTDDTVVAPLLAGNLFEARCV